MPLTTHLIVHCLDQLKSGAKLPAPESKTLEVKHIRKFDPVKVAQITSDLSRSLSKNKWPAYQGRIKGGELEFTLLMRIYVPSRPGSVSWSVVDILSHPMPKLA